MTKEKGGKKLEAHVTFFEMTTPNFRQQLVPTRPTVALMKASNISASFYAYLYEQVGKECHWEERRHMDEYELEEVINADNVDIRVMYADGCPAGFFELDLSDHPQEVEIKYFGLIDAYRGLGLAKWFLSTAISAAWEHKPEKIVLQTNTLDHPAALPLYQMLGFNPVAQETALISPWN